MGGLISKILFQPPDPPSYSDNKDGKIQWLTTSDGVKIPSVFLPSEGSDLCIVYSHGNATDLGQMLPFLELLRTSLKVNVFTYEYQGYGISTPKVKPSERRTYASMEAAIEYLTTQRNIPTTNIILFGVSLGTGPTCYISSKEHKFRGVILQSPFTSVIRIKMKVKNQMMFDMFENIDRIRKIECPVFIVHGKVDEVVPFEHGELLHSMLQSPFKPLWIDYAGHNNIMEVMQIERYLRKLAEFVQHVRRSTSSNGNTSAASTSQ